MATVKTDNAHYAAIAAKIRSHTGENTAYKPSEMPKGIDDACREAAAEGYDNGVQEGRDLGEKIGYEKGYAEGESVGYANGKADGYAEGETAGHAAGVTEGKQAEYDRFWDAFQDYGNRTDYMLAFRCINADYIRPKYKLKDLTQIQMMFQSSGVKKIESAYFDFSGTENVANAGYALFNDCSNLEEIEDINLPAVNYIGTWYYCEKLKKIAVVRCASGKTFDASVPPFYMCSELTDVTFTGTLNTSGLVMQWSKKLSRASIESIIGVLSSSASGKSITLSKAAVNNAFETSPGAADGASSAEWAALIATKPNWTISLV